MINKFRSSCRRTFRELNAHNNYSSISSSRRWILVRMLTVLHRILLVLGKTSVWVLINFVNMDFVLLKSIVLPMMWILPQCQWLELIYLCQGGKNKSTLIRPHVMIHFGVFFQSGFSMFCDIPKNFHQQSNLLVKQTCLCSDE